jgi:hypothetical protein
MKAKQRLGRQKRTYQPNPDYRANSWDIMYIGDAANMLRRLATGTEPFSVARELARTLGSRLAEVLERMNGGEQ